MRKYQQLLLVLVSIISVTVLIAYRSENERLQHVLSVVNFFGARDISLVKIENFSNFTYKFDYPLPSWTYLGNEFHGYSAFWRKNDLVAGGEAIALVIGSLHGNVMYQVLITFPGKLRNLLMCLIFQCKVHFSDNTIASGKFGFMRVEPEIEDIEIGTEKFLIYKFLCKTPKDFSGKPKNLIFINTENKSEHYMPIRQVNIKSQIMDKSLITACVDLNR